MKTEVKSQLVELDPAIALSAIEKFPDELAGNQRSAEALYRQHKQCPRGCGPTMEKSAAPASFAFGDPDWLIPRCLLTCAVCRCTYDPFNGLVVTLGNPDTVNAGGILLKGNQ